MKVFVDKSVCIGCGLCTSIASSIFVLDENGFAESILEEEVPSDLESAATEAVESCPVNAIKSE